jgi:hypothetical protein
MAHTIEDLRNHLFGTLASLRDTAAPMETERGRAIAEVARVIVDSAKVEVQHLALVGGAGSGFLPEPAVPGKPALPRPALVAQPGHAIGKGR